jgi:hypothetical protein
LSAALSLDLVPQVRAVLLALIWRRISLPMSLGLAKLTSMNLLTAFGLFAVTAMVVCYALESRSRWFVLGFAVSCVLGSIYGFLQGAWPFGLVEAIWSIIAARRWWGSSK